MGDLTGPLLAVERAQLFLLLHAQGTAVSSRGKVHDRLQMVRFRCQELLAEGLGPPADGLAHGLEQLLLATLGGESQEHVEGAVHLNRILADVVERGPEPVQLFLLPGIQKKPAEMVILAKEKTYGDDLIHRHDPGVGDDPGKDAAKIPRRHLQPLLSRTLWKHYDGKIGIIGGGICRLGSRHIQLNRPFRTTGRIESSLDDELTSRQQLGGKLELQQRRCLHHETPGAHRVAQGVVTEPGRIQPRALFIGCIPFQVLDLLQVHHGGKIHAPVERSVQGRHAVMEPSIRSVLFRRIPSQDRLSLLGQTHQLARAGRITQSLAPACQHRAFGRGLQPRGNAFAAGSLVEVPDLRMAQSIGVGVARQDVVGHILMQVPFSPFLHFLGNGETDNRQITLVVPVARIDLQDDQITFLHIQLLHILNRGIAGLVERSFREDGELASSPVLE